MTEIRTHVDIEASKEAVWDVLTDFPAYAEWNPLLVRVDTRAEPGAPVAMTVRVGGLRFAADARVLSVTPARQLRWAGPISKAKAFLFRGDHYFVIEEPSPGRVRFVHGENFTGHLVPAYHAYNAALKHRVESRMPARTTA